MSKTFRLWNVDVSWLLPPSVHEFVPAGHLAHFVRDTVREALDLSAILDSYTEERGQPPYHPGMLVALLLYGYSRGVYSSRRLARACEERLDVMAVTGLNRPDFRTISDFRKRHLTALSGLFVQVLRLCQAAGLTKLGHVAVDGTKQRANANKHKAMSYGRMKTAEPRLTAEVAAWFDQAAAADAAEDAQHGVDRRGDEMPAWVADKLRPAGAHPCCQGLSGRGGAQRSRRSRSRGPGSVLGDAAARRAQAEHRRPATGQGAAQLHRPRQSHPVDPERVHRRLQRSDRGGCGEPGHRRATLGHQPGRLRRPRAAGRTDTCQSRPQTTRGVGRQRLRQRGQPHGA